MKKSLLDYEFSILTNDSSKPIGPADVLIKLKVCVSSVTAGKYIPRPPLPALAARWLV